MLNYDISKPRVLEVEAISKKRLLTKSTKPMKSIVAKIKDSRTGREGTTTGEWCDSLRIGDKVKVRWERTSFRDKRTGKLKVTWAIRPAKLNK